MSDIKTREAYWSVIADLEARRALLNQMIEVLRAQVECMEEDGAARAAGNSPAVQD